MAIENGNDKNETLALLMLSYDKYSDLWTVF